jgi:hypothetical protein
VKHPWIGERWLVDPRDQQALERRKDEEHDARLKQAMALTRGELRHSNQ